VTDLFADALHSALESLGDVLDPDSLPDPMEFLPSSEEYSPDLFRPLPPRAEIFKGIIFIFLDEGQYSNLVTPINAGLGKALVFDPTGKTAEDLVRYVSTKGQVVLIRRNTEEEDTLCLAASKR
jgi:Second BRCT domain on Nijmegen syndrome breakage protein